MWVIPSLNRPEQCQQVIDRLGSTKHPGILIVNGGDYSSIRLPENWVMGVMSENVGLCGALRWAFSEYPNEPFYGMITDDEFLGGDNPLWESELVDAAGDWFIAHGNNGWQSGRRVHGYMTIGGKLMREVGWWMPEGLWHWYCDDFWETIARSCGLQRFCLNVRIENKHYLLKNVEKDSTYVAAESRIDQDRQLYISWIQSGEADKLCNRILSILLKIGR